MSESIESLTQKIQRLEEENLRLKIDMKKSQNLYSDIFYNAPVAFAISDSESGVYIDVNNQFCHILGLKLSGILGKTLRDINLKIHDSVLKNIDDFIRKYKEIDNIEINIVNGKNKEITVVLTQRIISVNGKDHYLSIIRDISDIRQSLGDLIESEEIFSSIFRLSPDPIVITRLSDSALVDVNYRFLEIFGFTSDELAGNSFISLNMIKTCESYDQSQSILKENGEFYDFEMEFVKKNGLTFRGLLSQKTLDIKGVPHVLTVIKDINQLKLYEKELVDLNRSLEERVDERTRELNEALLKLEDSNRELTLLNQEVANESYKLIKLNNKLAISEKQLMDAAQMKDRLISILAHDLKNPLLALSLSAEILMMKADTFKPVEIKGKAKQIFDVIKYLNNLIENLLTWSRSQQGKIIFNPRSINIKDIVDNCINLYQENTKQKDQTIVQREFPDMTIQADSDMIQTILRNLLSNAIKFTPKEGTITISAVCENNLFAISVKDTGVGMTPREVDNLFAMDLSLSSKGTSKETGTGLGLIICKEFVEKHNGTIMVESKKNLGTTFTISLPLE